MSRSLQGITSLYVDANVLIYLVEGNTELKERMLAAFREIEIHDIALYTSEITLTECLHGAHRAGLAELAKKYTQLLGSAEFISMLPVERIVCIEAARLGAMYRLKTVDSIHLASATLAACQGLLTNDRGFRSTSEVVVIHLDEFL